MSYNKLSMLVDSEVIKINSTKIYKRKYHIISYGCQMNFADSEVVASILENIGYEHCADIKHSDLILLNTCSIREKAEQTIRKKLSSINYLKKKKTDIKIGVLGCMAERLKEKFLNEEKIVDLVVGPDAYRDIPNLLKQINSGRDAVNVILSKEETYADIRPQRLNSNGISAFVSITRGCDNMCTFCVVPFTRGRERSRDPKSILSEINELMLNGFKEITLLGQNVDSYLWYGGGLKKDFKNASEIQKKTCVNFAKLLDLVAKCYPDFRIRFTTSNPQDMDVEVLKTMKNHKNICNHIHLPVQSGSNNILKAMNRQHSIEEYLELINQIRKILPDCGISHDIITGFPNETEIDHSQTLSLMNRVKYDFGFMFKYSERPGTLAARKLDDNVPEKVKQSRLSEIIDLQFRHSSENLSKFIGKKTEVLIEKESKKSTSFWAGRNEQNFMVVFPKENYSPGDFVEVLINKSTYTTLIGSVINKIK